MGGHPPQTLSRLSTSPLALSSHHPPALHPPTPSLLRRALVPLQYFSLASPTPVFPSRFPARLTRRQIRISSSPEASQSNPQMRNEKSGPADNSGIDRLETSANTDSANSPETGSSQANQSPQAISSHVNQETGKFELVDIIEVDRFNPPDNTDSANSSITASPQTNQSPQVISPQTSTVSPDSRDFHDRRSPSPESPTIKKNVTHNSIHTLSTAQEISNAYVSITSNDGTSRGISYVGDNIGYSTEEINKLLTTTDPVSQFPIPPDEIQRHLQDIKTGTICTVAWTFDRQKEMNIALEKVTRTYSRKKNYS